MEDVKILSIPAKFIYFTFLGLLSITIIFLIGFLAAPTWVSQGEGMTEWKGSLTKLTDNSDDLPDFLSDLEGDSYSSVADDFCDSSGKFKYVSSDLRNALCDLFENLYDASVVVILFEMINLLAIIAWMSLITLVFYGRNFFLLSLIVPGIALASHLIAFCSWIGIADATFEDDCKDLNDGDEPDKTCAQAGPKLGLFILIWMVFLYGLWFLFKLLSKLTIQKRIGSNFPSQFSPSHPAQLPMQRM